MSIFNDSKYTKWYYNIIQNAQSKEILDENIYYEKHHIIPKSLKGSNQQNNLVILTGKEHFVCHWLLTKMLTGKNLIKMEYAFCFMRMSKRTTKETYKIPGYIYEKLRVKSAQLSSQTHKGLKHSEKSKRKMSESHKGRIAWNKGISHSKETRDKISKFHKGKTISDEHKKKLSFKGQKHSEETKRKMSEYHKGHKHSEETKKKMSVSMKGRTWKLVNNKRIWSNID